MAKKIIKKKIRITWANIPTVIRGIWYDGENVYSHPNGKDIEQCERPFHHKITAGACCYITETIIELEEHKAITLYKALVFALVNEFEEDYAE